MPIEVSMPALSPTMKSGNLIKWLVKEGDRVNVGDVIAEIETDKAAMEIEAVDAGKLGKIIVSAGTKGVPVGTILGLILEEGEDVSVLDSYVGQAASNNSEPASDAGQGVVNSPKATKDDIDNRHASASASGNDRLLASPLARRLAKEMKIDLNTVTGSGPRGRIIKVDLESLTSDNSANKRLSAGQFDTANATTPVNSMKIIPHSQMRTVIAERLCESKQKAPHFYLNMECDVTRLLGMRLEMNDWYAKRANTKISINDIIIRASALALSQYPKVNASWQDDGILLYGSADVAVAVALDDGLITPIIRCADQKGVASISSEMRQLASRAREGKLLLHEFQGCGFSISNLGMYGVHEFYAIINFPQACILSVGTNVKRPIVNGSGAIAVADMMNIGLSADHRVVDGALAAEFLSYIKHLLENPLMLAM